MKKKPRFIGQRDNVWIRIVFIIYDIISGAEKFSTLQTERDRDAKVNILTPEDQVMALQVLRAYFY